MTGFWDAMALAGPHANNLDLAPDRQPQKHLITQFLQDGDLPDTQPTVSKHML